MSNTFELIKKVHSGDKISEEIIIKENMALVHSCVRKLWREGLEYDDLIQLGSIGLIKAIRRFDTDKGYMFSTYAVPLIIGEIKKFLRDDGIIKVSRTLKEIYIKVLSSKEKLSFCLGREATVNEIAGDLSLDTEIILLAMEACRPCDSLQRKLSPDSEHTVADFLENQISYIDEIDKIALKSALESLNPRDRKIIILRYFKGKTQAEISKIIGVSQVQISRIEKKIIESLKSELE